MSGGPIIIGPQDVIPARGKYVLAVPGHMAPIQRFDLPTSVKGSARVAIARQHLSDRLGGSGEGLSVIPLGSGDWTQAIVCETILLRQWCGTQAARHKRCLAVLPDMLTLPWLEDTLVLRGAEGALQVRAGQDDGFTAPFALAPAMLKSFVSSGDFTSYHMIGGVSPEMRAVLDDLALPRKNDVPSWKNPFVDLRTALAGDATRGLWTWAAAAFFALVAFGLWAAGVTLETRHLRTDATNIRTQTQVVLREGLIPEGPILDIRQQVARAISSAEGGTAIAQASSAELLSRATVALFGTGLQVGAIALAEGEHALAIDVSAPSFLDVDTLVQSLADSGFRAEATNMRNNSDNGVSARLIFGMVTPE